jgi:Cof subfamily protein (haloacid dehalogenase superfamily)
LIALDVDGTLLNDDYLITDGTKQAVRRAAEAGAVIVLCTGRSPVNTLPLMEGLGLEGVMITHNGAVTVHSRNQELLQQRTISQELLAPFIAYSRQNLDIHFDACTPFEIYNERMTEAVIAMYNKFILFPKQVPDLTAIPVPIVKFTLFGPESTIDQTEQELRQWDSPLSLIRSGVHFIDIMHPLATKGIALRQLAEEQGIPREQIMALGNYYNDLEMMEYAGLGIAMNNSPEPVKLSADAVTASNNEDGVAQAILKYFFN